MVYKNNPSKISSVIINGFIPINNAKQTTEVFTKDGKLKLQIKRKSFDAQELI
jgi:hypothetical protein